MLRPFFDRVRDGGKTHPNGDRVWTNAAGQLHREDGPAIIQQNGTRRWFANNRRHREDGPAVEYADGRRRWFIDGQEMNETDYNARIRAATAVVTPRLKL